MTAPVILEYNLDNAQKLKLRFVCAQLKIAVRSVLKADYLQPVGALADAAARTEAAFSGEGFSDEMLVMANFTNALLHAFLKSTRQAKMRAIPLKAVLTPTNAAWDSVRLHDEILKEHTAMQGGGR